MHVPHSNRVPTLCTSGSQLVWGKFGEWRSPSEHDWDPAMLLQLTDRRIYLQKSDFHLGVSLTVDFKLKTCYRVYSLFNIEGTSMFYLWNKILTFETGVRTNNTFAISDKVGDDIIPWLQLRKWRAILRTQWAEKIAIISHISCCWLSGDLQDGSNRNLQYTSSQPPKIVRWKWLILNEWTLNSRRNAHSEWHRRTC